MRRSTSVLRGRSSEVLSVWSTRIERVGRSKLIHTNLREPDVELFISFSLSLVRLMKSSTFGLDLRATSLFAHALCLSLVRYSLWRSFSIAVGTQQNFAPWYTKYLQNPLSLNDSKMGFQQSFVAKFKRTFERKITEEKHSADLICLNFSTKKPVSKHF